MPLFSNQALGIALFSYDGGLYWGFNADWDAVPDLHDLVGFVEAECRALRDGAASAPNAPVRERPAQRVPPARRAARARRRRPAVARR